MTRCGRLSAVVGLALSGLLTLSGCSSSPLDPASDLTPASPEQFVTGAGAAITEGAGPQDFAPDGSTFWWFTSRRGTVSVLNGSSEPALVRMSATLATPCPAPAETTFTKPDGSTRTFDAIQTGVRVVLTVRVPAQGSVPIRVAVDGDPCRPPGDSRTLYVGLLNLAGELREPKPQ
jgi:hypothetical protein